MASAVVPKPGPQACTNSTLKDLLRSLLTYIEESEETNPRRSGGRKSEEILLDVDLDDARYLILRMPKAAQRALLSPREWEIVRMVAQGHPNKVIADCLGISAYTVCTYLRRIFLKTGVGSRAAMVAKLMDTKWPSPMFERSG